MLLRRRERSGRYGGGSRLRLVGVVVAGLVCLMVVVGVAGASQFGGGRGPVSGAGSRSVGSSAFVPSRDRAGLVRNLRLARARAARRQRWLESPRVRAQRVASRMAFHGLSGVGAERLLVGNYGSVVAGVSGNAAAAVARSGRVVRYLGDYEAVVRGVHGLRIERSTTPLEVGDGAGKRPVDLTLQAAGGAFVSAAPVAGAGVSIARDSAGGVAVGSSGLRITLEGAPVAGKQGAGQSVFFGSAGADMDASVAPTINGAELFAVLRSRLSPQEIRYRVALPVGARLEEHAGGAVVSRGGDVLARVAAPDARDAQGSVVPVSMLVSGDELLLSISHRRRDIAYPVLVDPAVTVPIESNKGWVFAGSEGIGWAHSSLSIAAEASFPLSGGGDSGEASWSMGVPESLILSKVEVLGISGYTKAERLEWNGDVEWSIQACHEGVSWGGSGETTLPTSLTFNYSGKSCRGAALFRVELGLYGAEFHPVKASGSISVGSILVTYTPSAAEEEELGFELFGEGSGGAPGLKPCFKGHPVNCATGNQVETQSDLSVGGRGPGLHLTRTYNSLAASAQSRVGVHGPFGYGWAGTDSAHLTFPSACFRSGYALCEKRGVDVYEDNGSASYFEGNSGGPYTPTDPLVQAKLVKEGSSYIYTLPDQSKLTFNEAGQLMSRADRDGNTLTMSYESGHLVSATDGAGRKLTFAYNGEGEVASVKDPLGHTVKYEYEGGNLISVTQPAEASIRWKFKYNSSSEMTEMTDGRGHTITTEYNEAHQVTSQTDAMLRERSWKYATTEAGDETTITEPNGSEAVEKFNKLGLPTSVVCASGTAIAATTTYEYNGSDELVAAIDPNKHKTEYGYDSEGNKTSEIDPNKDELKWKYDKTHDIETETTPDGETTTYKREAHGNPEVIERPAPGSKTQKTTLKHAANGDLESVTDPLEHTWKYEYDSYGDRKAETDPEGNKRTWEYNEDSQVTATVSPRGNVTGGKPAEFTTKIELSAKGQPLKVTDPLSHTTKYTYDGNGNVETLTDGNSNKTTYTYDPDNELTKIEEPNKTITETEYDAMGQITAQIDGNKHKTEYKRNLLEEVTEVINPKERKTTKEYDPAGNLVKLTDPEKRTTTYTYDPANRLKEVSYSDGKTHAVSYEYNKDGDRTKMTDGTGTTKYEYDELDRPTETENGHKELVKYEYNLANAPIKITYPNKKVVAREYDKDERLNKVTDGNSKESKFVYNRDSDLEKTTFPSETKDEDTYAYNDADQMSEVKMLKSTETLASLAYTRDNDGQVKTVVSKGLPGEEKPAYEYDVNNRLTKGTGIAYEYDAANNPTKLGTSTYKYSSADELESGTGFTYAYNEAGQRTKTTPTTGPATTYGYYQAGNLTSVERPKEGSTPEIKDSYAYNGEDLRASQTISGTTTYMAWDLAEELPLLLSDGTNSYIYGPEGLPIEQISSGGTTLYLHHDQQGSTRLLTGSAGTSEATFTYDSYGNLTGHTGTATTPLGYDGQYTSSDTGLIYMRARAYDPATAQFLSVDPLAPITEAPYTYTYDNPINGADPTGLGFFGEVRELGEEAGEGVAGFGDKLTFGLTKDAREALGDENVNTCSAGYQAGGYAGLATAALIPGEDDAEAAELGAEGVDEVGNTVTSTTRATPGGDGAESVIIKERGPNGETLQVVHQVGKPLPGGGTIIIHQHSKYGPLPGSELDFPDVEP
jgi:RHS repeat-associated protein